MMHIDEVSNAIKKSFDQAGLLKSEGRDAEAIGVLEAALLFAEDQFGVRVSGESHRVRRNGERIDSWRIITMPLCVILMQLTSLCIDQRSQGSMERALVHALEARALIEPRRGSIECSELDYVHTLFFQTESSLAQIHIEMFQLEIAEYHCEQSLAFARLSRGADSCSCVFEALKLFGALRRQQSRLSEATALCEEAYIVVSGAHGPVHSLVQEAAAELIECLTLAGEYSQAEAYSRITYESLIDPRNGIDPESEGAARGMQQLANLCVCLAREGHDLSSNLLEEAEGLVRKACGIMENLYGPASSNLAICLETLGQVFIGRGVLEEETRNVFERVLAIFIECEGGGEVEGEGRGELRCGLRSGLAGRGGGGHGTLQALGSLGDFYSALIPSLPLGEQRAVESQRARAVFERAASMSVAIYGSQDRAVKYEERARRLELLTYLPGAASPSATVSPVTAASSAPTAFAVVLSNPSGDKVSDG